MKKIFLLPLLLLPAMGFAQQITEEEYLRLDKELWERYERDSEAIYDAGRKNPGKRDSLSREVDRAYENVRRENEELAIRYASTPTGLKRLFMVRLNLPKERVRATLEALPEAMQQSPYGKSIRMHLDNDQIEPGKRYVELRATRPDNSPFLLSALEGSPTLLFYGGLDCMGQQRRDELAALHKDHSGLNIVVYWPCSSLENLQKLEESYNNADVDYVFVSDFLQDQSPFKILYGAQVLPTCFLIDKTGTVVSKEAGFDAQQTREKLKGVL